MTSCGCVYVDYDEFPEFTSRKTYRARKRHECGECGRIIEPGERYERASGLWDGQFSEHKTCDDCLSVRESFFCAGYMYEFIWEHLRDHIWDMSGEISSDCLVPLTPRARADVCEIIEDVWADIETGEEAGS